MFGHLFATIIGLLVVVLSGAFVTIINPIVGIPFILCGIFLLLFPNFLSNKLFDRSKDPSVSADHSESSELPRIENYKLSGVEYHTEEIRSLGTENPDYLLDREAIIAKQIGGENLYPYTFESLPAQLKIQGEEVAVVVQGKTVGIIGRNNRERVRRLLSSDRMESAAVKITGGPRRILSAQDGQLHDYQEDYTVRLEITIRSSKEAGGASDA